MREPQGGECGSAHDVGVALTKSRVRFYTLPDDDGTLARWLTAQAPGVGGAQTEPA